MKLNKAIVNNYLNNTSPEDQKELLAALLDNFSESISNLSLAVLDYPKEKALKHITKSQYNILNRLPRNFFYTTEEIREDVKFALQNLTEVELQKVYNLLLNIAPLPKHPQFQSNSYSSTPKTKINEIS